MNGFEAKTQNLLVRSEYVYCQCPECEIVSGRSKAPTKGPDSSAPTYAMPVLKRDMPVLKRDIAKVLHA